MKMREEGGETIIWVYYLRGKLICNKRRKKKLSCKQTYCIALIKR